MALVQQKAKIFPAENRERSLSKGYRCLYTLGSHKGHFGKIARFSEETLAPEVIKILTVEENTLVALVPLVGVLQVTNLVNPKKLPGIIPGELEIIPLTRGTSFSLQNPHKKQLANYLQIHFKTEAGKFENKCFQNYGYNQLYTIFQTQKIKMYFGVFNARVEATLVLGTTTNILYAFSINGNFEVQNRLLGSRDGLALWNVEVLELEAFSENTIILLLETEL